ncbi:MAG TPA: response regulator, partial [Kofleriaceae bacterium]|nr:response regulator [Kofleriaceae bacterium]
MKARVLVCDDKENFTKLFRRILPEDRYDVTTAEDGARALALVAAGDFDVIVSDIRMPGADGLAVLREAKSRDLDAEVVLMTAFATVPAAVDAIREGAYDYLAKPFEPDEALLVVDRALERRRLRQQARDLRRALDGIHRIDNLIARSPAMGAVV